MTVGIRPLRQSRSLILPQHTPSVERQRQSILIICVILLVASLVGCGVPMSPSAIAKTPEAQYMNRIVDGLRARNFSLLESALDSGVKQTNVLSALEQTAAIFPVGKPTSIEFVGWDVINSNRVGRIINISAQYGFNDNKWILISAQLKGTPEKFTVWGFHAGPIPSPLSVLNAFTLAGKGRLHYVFLFAAIIAFSVSIFAFVLCLRVRSLKRKWLWAVFTLTGVCAFSLDWTTGAVNINPFAINLFSAAVVRSGFVGPWVVTFCLPVGALFFLIKLKIKKPNMSTTTWTG